jgi:hypothetical protein
MMDFCVQHVQPNGLSMKSTNDDLLTSQGLIFLDILYEILEPRLCSSRCCSLTTPWEFRIGLAENLQWNPPHLDAKLVYKDSCDLQQWHVLLWAFHGTKPVTSSDAVPAHRCLIPSGQFHLTLATLKLREEDLQVRDVDRSGSCDVLDIWIIWHLWCVGLQIKKNQESSRTFKNPNNSQSNLKMSCLSHKLRSSPIGPPT